MAASGAKLICLCDGGFDIGFGHVSRCLALAEAFEELGWRAAFAGRLREGAAEMVRSAGFELAEETRPTGEEPEAVVRLLQQHAAAAVIVDSYAVREDYLRRVAAEFAVLLIDDYARLTDYPCDAIFHPSVTRDNLPYPTGKLLLEGAGYAPFRRAFRKERQGRRLEKIKRVLVTIGGGDRLDVTRRVVAALARHDRSLIVRAVVGRGYPWQAELREAVAQMGAGSSVLVQLQSLAAEMAAADLCVSGGGMTKYEAAYLGLPCVAIPVTEDQVPETRLFAELGLAAGLPRADLVSAEDLHQTLHAWLPEMERWQAMSRRGLALFPQDPTRACVEKFLELPRLRRLAGTAEGLE